MKRRLCNLGFRKYPHHNRPRWISSHVLAPDLLTKFPDIKLAADQPFRQWDLAIDIAEESEISLQTAIEIAAYCEERGARASISNIHVNIWFGDYSKQEMSLRVLEGLGQEVSTAVYIGVPCLRFIGPNH